MNKNKTRVVSFRMNKSNLDIITKIAKQLNFKKSTVLRLAIFDSLSKYRPIRLSDSERTKLFSDNKQAISDMEKLLTKVDMLNRYSKVSSDNINQIARSVNSGEIDSLNGLLPRNLKRDATELIHNNDELGKKMNKIWELLILPIHITGNRR